MSPANSFEYALFGHIEDGKMMGLDVDLANEVGRRMGGKVTFGKVDFKGFVAALISGRPGSGNPRGSGHEDGAGDLAVLALEANRAVSANPDELRKT
jgi:extracellular solute-binding protein (family 3)